MYCTTVHNLYKWTAFLCTQLQYNLTLPSHTRGAHTMLGSVVLLYVYTLVQFVYACTVILC